MSTGIAFATIIVTYFFSVAGKSFVEFITGFRFELDCWPWPGKHIKGLLGRIKSCKKLLIPSLLGMILLGCMARNLLPYNSFMEYFPDTMSSYLREGCLACILLRAGMELDKKYIGGLAIYLAIFPPLIECVVISLTSIKLFDMSTVMAFSFGFVAVAIGPGIIIPILIDL